MTTSLISLIFSPASLATRFSVSIVSSTKSSIILSNFALVSVFVRCFGPVASAVINGKFIVVSIALESSFLAFSAASFRRCIAITSFLRSIPLSALNSLSKKSITLLSKSSPPKKAFPPVESTSTTLSPVSRTVTSNVPPPRS